MRNPIPNQWNVPARFRARMGDAAGRQRAMVHEGHLLLVLHEVPQAGRPERVARLFWRDAAGQWKASGQGAGLAALREHLTDFERAVDELEEHLRLATRARDWFDVLREATPLQRTAHHLAQTLQAARDAVEDRELITLRDRANDVERAIDLVTAEARDAIDFVTAQKAEAQAAVSLELARASHSLNVVAAVFLPMTALASIFGMELRSGLEALAGPWLFWGVVMAGVALGLVMHRRLTRAEGAPPRADAPRPPDSARVPVRA
ncbi:MAG: CorA family divalent cation transporter [Myxococcaceae bacterium]|jgi:hypothetical protein|nr:CorA family divalent cation transporter [Myxococcaceae bacterium]